MQKETFYLLLATALLGACDSDGESAPTDASLDASNDSAVEPSGDAALDASRDAAVDGSIETCGERSAATCTGDDSCRAVYARLEGQASGANPAFVACVLDDSCSDGDVVTCAQNDATGELAAFTTNCVPEGWSLASGCDDGEDAGGL
jgi:hypothetical protein